MLFKKINPLSEDDRKTTQNARLINQDFPWLWAVKNNWCPAWTQITIMNADKEHEPALRHFLSLPCTITSFRAPDNYQVWIHYGTLFDKNLVYNWSKVMRIEILAFVDRNIAKEILESIPAGYSVMNIVVVAPSQFPQAHPDSYVIYRIKGNYWKSFNKLLAEVSQQKK
ncbi:MAG: hypothetical protein Q8P77_02490 [Candidatus Veblenbacteria bacterium]|nr:hypothetical protein [Candidatus Veblenbacteria bacterium]